MGRSKSSTANTSGSSGGDELARGASGNASRVNSDSGCHAAGGR